MATSYKIRLKRFNGLDYDTLNLSSENIIRNNGNTVEQEFNNIIPSSNGMLKNNNGVFNVATLGTDYTAVDDSLTSSTTKTYSIDKQIDTFAPFDMLGIVIDGNSTPIGAVIGQYVIVKNSTISGITNGLYTAKNVIPANTAIDSTYLTKVNNGGFNGILNLLPSDENLVRIHNEQAVDFNAIFTSSNCRGIHLYFYANNSSYKPDDKGGFALQYCWSPSTGIQLAFTGNADMYVRWNWAGIGYWRKFAYA